MKRTQAMRFLDSLPTESAERIPNTPSLLGVGIHDDFFIVQEIADKPVPREDGYMWSERELEHLDEEQPFGKAYRDDRIDRLYILQANPNYRFIREIAGAMRRDPVDLFEEDDLARVMAEENQERRRIDLEMQRTLTGPDQKTRAITQLKERSSDLLAQIKRLESVSPVSYLVNLSRRLIDDEAPVAAHVVHARSYGFVHLMQYAAEYALLHSLVTYTRDDVATLDPQLKQALRSLIVQIRVQDPGRAERVQAYVAQADNFEHRRLLFVFLLYHRDFLSNARYDYDRVSLMSSLLIKMIYALQPVRNIMLHHPIYRQRLDEFQRLQQLAAAQEQPLFEGNEVGLMDVQENEEEGLGDFDEIIAGRETFPQRERPQEVFEASRDIRLGEYAELSPLSNDLAKDKRDSFIIFQVLGLSYDVWTELELIYDDPGAAINWNLFRETPTINLRFFLDADIANNMVTEANCREMYKADSCADIVRFAFVGNVQRAIIVQRNQLAPFTVYSPETPTGLPLELIQLIKRQLPDYVEQKNVGDLPVAADIIKSNFLALYYNVMKGAAFAGVIDKLDENKERIMLQRLDALSPLISQLVVLYKFLMLYYFLWIIEYFKRAITSTGLPVWRLSDDVRILLDEHLLPPEQQPQLPQEEDMGEPSPLYRAYDEGLTLDALNAAFYESDVEDFIQDEIFKEYLHTGQNAFITTREQKEAEAKRRADKKPRYAPQVDYVRHRVEGYPILQLHYIFVAYQRYVTEYSRFLQEKVAETDNAIKLATEKLNALVGEERIESAPRRPENFVNRKSFATAPINSGVVQIKAEIKTILNRAYHNVMLYCDGLRGCPLDALQSDSAFDQGLMGEFVEYMTAVYKSNTLRFQDNYKTRQEYQQAAIDLAGLMQQLKRWRYRRLGTNYYFYRTDLNGHRIHNMVDNLLVCPNAAQRPRPTVTVLPFQ